MNPSGTLFLPTQLRSDQRSHNNEEEPYNPDLVTQILTSTPTTRHKGPYRHTTTNTTPRTTLYTLAVTPPPTLADKATGVRRRSPR
jgi:hypothetical protein